MDQLATATGEPLSLPKRIATLALFVQATSDVDDDVALQTAMSALGQRVSSTRGGLKKASSEARAIMHFGVQERLRRSGGDPPSGLLQRIAGLVARVKMRDVTRARAAALGGMRGGRPQGPREPTGVAAIRTLVDRALSGDPDAQAELEQVEEIFRSYAAAYGGSSRSQPVMVSRGVAA